MWKHYSIMHGDYKHHRLSTASLSPNTAPPPLQSPSADYLEPHSDNFGRFL